LNGRQFCRKWRADSSLSITVAEPAQYELAYRNEAIEAVTAPQQPGLITRQR
jgi:hypothetical protein